MTQAAVITLMLVITGWFFLKEYPSVAGLFVPTCALQRRSFKLLVIAAVALGAALAAKGDIARGVSGTVLTEDSGATLIIMVSALATVIVLEYLRLPSSIILAALGAMEGLRLADEGSLRFCAEPFAQAAASAVICAALAALLYFLFRTILRHSQIHLLRLAIYFRYAVIFAIAAIAFAIGLHAGGMLCGIAEGALGTRAAMPAAVAALTLPQLALWRVIGRRSDLRAERCTEWSTRSVLALTLSVSAVMLLFAQPFAGMRTVPLSPLPLIYAAIFGIELVRRRQLTESENIARGLAAMLLAPAVALVCSYLLGRIAQGGGSLLYFSIMTGLLLLVFCAVAASYIAAQRRQKAEMSSILLRQQQQLEDNRKAIGDLEIRSMVSENRALHDALESKRKETMSIALSICEQKEYLESLAALVRELSETDRAERREELLGELDSSIRQRLSFEQEVDSSYFYAQAEALHKDFSLRLEAAFPDLTRQEKRLATLLRLGFSSKYIATLMNITTKSVEIGRYRLRSKLGLGKGDNLVQFIKSI